MKIAIDISPLKNGRFLQHRVRGSGFYTENLRRALEKYFPNNQYIFFTRGFKLPKNINLVHYPYFEPFFLTLPLKKVAPTVVTVHDLTPLVFPKYFPSGVKGKIKWQIQKFSLSSKEAIITDSINSKKDIAKYTGIPEERIDVVYLAPGEEFREIKETKSLERTRVKYNLSKNFALYVGDATWNKNLPRLCEAVKKLNIPLVMVGKALVDRNFNRSNPWNQDLVKIHQLCEGDERIIRLGFVPQEDLVLLYNLATIFTMPSIYEGFGLPVLEAMSCGTPVVTTKEGSLPEVAGEAAFYVDAFNTENVARGIGEVFFSEKLQNDLSQKGYVQAKKFSWEKTAKVTMRVYEQVLSIKY